MEQPRVVPASLVCVILLAGLQVTRASASSECQAGEVYCTSNDLIVQCLPSSRVCDGTNDCYDGEDEYNCECSLPFVELGSGNGSPCVLLDDIRHSWQEARDLCLSRDADLAVLHDWDFYRDLVDFLHKRNRAHFDYWVGATDEVEEGVWTWVDGTPVRMATPLWGLYHHSGSTYSQEPYYSYANGQDCGYLQGDQHNYMVDGDCTNTKTFVCQKKKSPNHRTKILTKDGSINATTITPAKAAPATKTCTAPFEVLGQRCVWLAMEEVIWYEAMNVCRRLGAKLAPVSDIGLHADLVDYFEFKGVTGTSFWVGANDTIHEGQWKWLNGKTVRMGTPLWRTVYSTYYNIWYQEPDTPNDMPYSQDCGILDHTAFHYMADLSCYSKLPAVCLMH